MQEWFLIDVISTKVDVFVFFLLLPSDTQIDRSSIVHMSLDSTRDSTKTGFRAFHTTAQARRIVVHTFLRLNMEYYCGSI